MNKPSKKTLTMGMSRPTEAPQGRKLAAVPSIPLNADQFIAETSKATVATAAAAPKPEHQDARAMQRMNFMIPADLHEQLRRKCFERKVSMASALIEMIRKDLDHD